MQGKSISTNGHVQGIHEANPGVQSHLCYWYIDQPSHLLQSDLQPLHYAALTGQLEIIQLLIEVYKVPADTTATV